MSTGKLYLLPNLLDESAGIDLYLPASLGRIVETLQGLITESEKEARRYLRKFLSHDAMAAVPLRLLNEHTTSQETLALLDPILQGETWGLISDAGLPCIADPGSDLVALAQKKQISVQAVVGPSSILMALQLSGFSGQKFAFHGYLPREAPLLEKKLRELEKKAKEEAATQIWIEAPYRSSKLLEEAKRILQPSTLFCVAASLTSVTERCLSLSIADWRKRTFALEKEPAIFLLSN